MASTTFLNLLLSLGNELWNSSGQVRSIQVPLASYDYIICGAGASGAVLASRLSQDPNKTVLLLEAGGASNRVSDIPYVHEWYYSPLAHLRYSETQKNVCNQYSPAECTLPSGRLLGGGTAINAMTYVRGNRLDYDGYAALGLPSWSYDKVLPFFKKFENSVNYKSKYRGEGGPVNITTDQWAFLNSLSQRWISAGKEIFNVGPGDYNGRYQKAFSKLQRLIYRGIRQSSDKTYLQPLDQKRENLHVLTFAHVRKVLFEGTKAVGVEFFSSRYYDNNTVYTVKAEKEVILSAGTYGTPQILMLSGIGPQAHLKDLGISVVANRPGVGQNLQDPILVSVNFDTNMSYPADGHVTEENYRQYLTLGNSILKSTGLCGLAFLPSIRSNPGHPDDIRTEYTFSFNEPSGNDTFELVISYYSLVPSSRGYVKLRSTDPLVNPIIDPKYLTDDGDMKEAIATVKDIIKLSKASSLQQIGLTPTVVTISGCNYTAWTDEYIKCYLRLYGDTSIHASGTSKMGNSSDPMAVVDDQLRVYGIQNLRVVDGSIFPTVPRAHPTAPCMMAAEVAASLIINGTATA
ncbi:Glucose dehydrogenase -like protein [Halotydeus destructor]|nr:Glucose dehydrogenase -like protein [Halotydeus destructor]